MTIHVMLDLETWGKKPGCDLRSISACIFAPHARHGGSLVHDGSLGTIRPFYIAVDNPPEPPLGSTALTPGEKGYYDGVDLYRRYPLIRDPGTVQWWSEQSDEAQGAFTGAVDLRDGLGIFAEWLYGLTGDTYTLHSKPPSDLRLWSHGPAFDPPILAAAYDAVQLPIPWNYRAPRDTRTAFDLAGIDDDGDGSYRTWLTQFNTGTAHNALDDAIAQAKAVCEAYKILQDWPGAIQAGKDSALINEARDHADSQRKLQLAASTTTADMLDRLANALDRDNHREP